MKKIGRRIGIKLIFDNEAKGSIKVTPGFTDKDIIFQCECLKEWVADMTTLLEVKIQDLLDYGKSVRKAHLEDRERN